MVVRRNWGMAIAAVGCLGLTVASCGYSRLIWGTTSVFYPLSRMFLAVLVVMVWAFGGGSDADEMESVGECGGGGDDGGSGVLGGGGEAWAVAGEN